MQKYKYLFPTIVILTFISLIIIVVIAGYSGHSSKVFAEQEGTYVNPESGLSLAPVFRKNRGRIPILMYHNIITPRNHKHFTHISDKIKRYFVTSKEFRQQLDTLYRRNFRPISLDEYLSFMNGDNNSLRRLAPGTFPFVLTFDDATYGQFDFIGTNSNGEALIDPDCAVGIMASFAAAHPDFKLNAAFSIDFQNPPFMSAKEAGRKLNMLLDMGFELVNHTANHLNLSKESVKPSVVNYEIGRAMEIFSSYLGYRANSINIVCYPGGYENPSVIRQIKKIHYNGKTYHFKAALDAEGYQAYLPNSKRFNPYRIARIELNNDTFRKYVLNARGLYHTPLLYKKSFNNSFSVLKDRVCKNR